MELIILLCILLCIIIGIPIIDLVVFIICIVRIIKAKKDNGIIKKSLIMETISSGVSIILIGSFYIFMMYLVMHASSTGIVGM